MGDSRSLEQIDEIKTLLSSEETKALAYPKLLNLQQASETGSSSVQLLASSSHAILASLISDIFASDEEIAAQALKCTGFMIYHPIIVGSIQADDANAIIESLVKVIVISKIKSVCNLGVWCLSIQQFGSSLLDKHFQSLLRAIIHALDNPIGSLSTTFEAMQAVVNLIGSLPKQMRDTASVWTPPVYRRLVSVDKRDRDMSERCLLKISSIICPPTIALSKAISVDMKKNLLLDMKRLLDQGMKVQCLQAWGWVMRLIGPYAIKKKLLVNEMLKILERTFSDSDSQVQIASLVAWEGLIDAFIEPQIQTRHIPDAAGGNNQVLRKSEGIESQNEADSRSKRIKLIMAPLTGIVSSKCDVSVQASCLTTWCYILHKLEASVICQSVIKTVWEPIIELVFQVGPDNKNIWSWNFCLDLLNSLILGRDEGMICNIPDQQRGRSSLTITRENHLASGKCPIRRYPICYSPWSLCHVDYFIKMISIVLNCKWATPMTSECRRLANDGALRLFASLLEAVQLSFRCVSIAYDEVMQCLNTILRFLTETCEMLTSEADNNHVCSYTCLQFIETVTKKLDPSFLESPLYKVELDPKYNILKFVTEIGCTKLPGICFVDYEDRVPLSVYLNVLYFLVVKYSCVKRPEYELLLEHTQGYMKFLLSSHRSLEVLHTFLHLLYKSTKFDCLGIWIVLANSLKNWIDGEGEQIILKMDTVDMGYSVVVYLLSYPFASWYLSQINMEVQIVSEVWKLLYGSVNRALRSFDCRAKSFCEHLCAMLVGFIQTENQLKEKEIDRLLRLYGSAIICVLNQLTGLSVKGNHSTDSGGTKSNINNCMKLVSRFMNLFWENKERTIPSDLSVVPRFVSSLIEFVRCLKQKEDIVVLIETASGALVQWLSDARLLAEKNSQLQILWTEILKSLQQSEPPMQFDSSFLKFHEPLLAITLDHPNPAISEPTINFWNSTYGRQMKLDFPHNLLPILDKLSRNGKLKLFTRNHYMEDRVSSLRRCGVPATLKKSSKRVEIAENPVNGSDFENLCSRAKRRRPELTEHQKEVRRAQQGRSRDCDGHGPGFRTYTTVDFSQGNEESQDSQEIRNVESILEMLRTEN